MKHETLLSVMALERERAALVEFLTRTSRDAALRIAGAYGADIRMDAAAIRPQIRARVADIVEQMRRMGVEIDA